MIAQQLLQCGLLQLGLFDENGSKAPYRLKLELLPAYPHLFAKIVDDLTSRLRDIQTQPDRLVAGADAVALAGAVSLRCNISLVYSRGRGEPPVHDLAGAYNFGHPSSLIVNTIQPGLSDFIAGCGRVGLDIQTVIPVIDTSPELLPSGVQILPLISLSEVIRDLESDHAIPVSQVQTMRSYLTAAN